MRRTTIQSRLDRFVIRHRFELAVVVPIVGAILLVASAEGYLPEPLAFALPLVLLGALAMRTPLLVGIGPVLDRRALAGLGAVAGFAYLLEWIAIATGLPYGEFEYGVALGPTVAGVPVALALLFVPLVIDARLLVGRLLGGGWHRTILGSVGIVVAIDLALDPAAVALGFWAFTAGGPYYDVPLSNFAGWLFAGTIAVAGVEYALSGPTLEARLEECPFILDDLVSFTVLWGTVNAFYGQWLPVLVCAGIGSLLWLAVGRTIVPVFRPHSLGGR